MKNIKLAMALLLLFPCPLAGAQVSATKQPNVVLRGFGHVGHYVTHHKEILAASALTVLALSADAASSVHCESVSPFCKESNPILGSTPSHAATWGYAMGVGAAVAVMNYSLFSLANGDSSRHVVWMWTLPLLTTAAMATDENVCQSEQLQAHNALLAQIPK